MNLRAGVLIFYLLPRDKILPAATGSWKYLVWAALCRVPQAVGGHRGEESVRCCGPPVDASVEALGRQRGRETILKRALLAGVALVVVDVAPLGRGLAGQAHAVASPAVLRPSPAVGCGRGGCPSRDE